MRLAYRNCALAGMACLFFGPVLPLAHVPVLGDITLLSYSFTGSFLVLIGLLAAGLCLYLGTYRTLGAVGIALVALFIVGAIHFEIHLAMARAALRDSLRGNPFGGLADAAIGAAHIEFGVLVLILGAILLIVAWQLHRHAGLATHSAAEGAAIGTFVRTAAAQNRPAVIGVVAVVGLALLGALYLDYVNQNAPFSRLPNFDNTTPASSDAGTPSQVDATTAPAPTVSRLAQYIRVQPLGKQFIPADAENGQYSDLMQLTLQYHNIGPKAIAAFKGVLIFTNRFGDRVQGYKIDYEDGLRPGAITTQTDTWDYNQFMSDDQNMRAAAFSTLRFEWKPTSIIFTDGGRLNDE